MQKLRNKIPKPIKKKIRATINWTELFILSVKGKLLKIWRNIVIPTATNDYHLAILCIKKTVYADMSIVNINSLHILNPNHKITIYCDTICFDYLQKRKNKFDYPKNIFIERTYEITDKPWQYYKIDVLIKAAWKDQIETDADGI